MYALKGRKRVRKTMDMDADKLRRARKLLAAESDTEAVDRALALVLANQEIENAIDGIFGKLEGFAVK